MIRPGNPRCGCGDGSPAGQPRPVEDARRPSAAERVRTLVDSSVSAVLGIPGDGRPADPPGGGSLRARAVDTDGDVIALVAGSHPAARAAAHARDGDLTAVMEITDVAPVAVPQRVRGSAWLAGWLTPVRNSEWRACAWLLAERAPAAPPPGDGWAMLRLEAGEAYVDDLWGAGPVEPDAFAAARPDPLAGHEAELLQHLAAAHHGQVRSLCALLDGHGPDGCHADGDRVAPLALDRFGVRLRLGDEAAWHDARFAFPEPVRDVTELRTAMHRLFEAAATAG